MTDRDFLAGLRAVAESTADALEGRASLARDADQYQAAEVADLAANGFRALAELAATRLGAERVRLVAAVRDAETATRFRRELERLGAVAAEALATHGIRRDEDTLAVDDPQAALWAFAEALIEVKDTADTIRMERLRREDDAQ